MKKEASRSRFITIVGYFFMFCCYLGFLFGNIFKINVRIINNITDYGDRYLFLQTYYPYDYSKDPYFFFTNASQVIGGVLVGMTLAISENYFVALVYHVCGQLEILGENFKNYNSEEDSKQLSLATQDLINKKFGLLVKRHTSLIR